MAAKRGNPVEQASGRKVLSQQVANPVANGTNVDKGNEKMRVPASKGKVLSQKVGNPVARRQMNKSGAMGAA
jgi:hypothetical protein